jgi:membrane protein YqaA with SNARE-associated domain
VSATAVARWFAWINGPDSRSAGDDANLRAWFAGFLSWLAVLTGVGVWWFARVEAGLTGDLGVWLAAVGMFYLSLCCLFLPLPTAWVVLLLASNDVALTESVPVRVMVVALLCAFATGVANLNEYHILTFMLRYRAVGRLRETRLYQLAASWFSVAPFWTITAFSFIPVPVDVVRVLAIAARYSRIRFAGAYFVGRFFRYGLLALSAAGLKLTTWDIVIIQVVLVLLAGLKVVHSVFRRRRCRSLPGGEDAGLARGEGNS